MDIKELYKQSGALLEGHFLLASGKHSAYYLQSAKLLEDPKKAQMIAEALAKKIREAKLSVDSVCSPAIGGILAGYELARALGVRFIFVEKDDGKMVLRRGFEVKESEHILICEDIITTGGSAQKAADTLGHLGAKPVGYAAIASRGICKGKADQEQSECKLNRSLPLFALGEIAFEAYEPDLCPLCKMGMGEAIKPGSKG